MRPAATAAGVAYVAGRPFHPGDDGANELRLSFSALGEAELAAAVERLAGVIAAA
jgi:2-aminoadipate transaminase